MGVRTTNVTLVCVCAVTVLAVAIGLSSTCGAEDDCFSADPVFVGRDRREPEMLNAAKLARQAANLKAASIVRRENAAGSLGRTASLHRGMPRWAMACLVIFAGSSALLAVLVLSGKGPCDSNEERGGQHAD